VQIASNSNEPLLIQGNGKIVPVQGESVTRSEVTLAQSSQIESTGLVIVKSLSMNGQSSLRAAADSKITLEDKKVAIEFVSSGKDLPTLNLGKIGDTYKIVPKSLTVHAPTGLNSDELKTFSHTLLSGETLSNCEEWQKLVELDSTLFTKECVSGSGSKLLAGVRSLVIKGSGPQPTTSGPPVGVIVGVVVGVVVVGVVIGVVIFMRRKNAGTQSDSNSAAA
jgi:hypothetical protein